MRELRRGHNPKTHRPPGGEADAGPLPGVRGLGAGEGLQLWDAQIQRPGMRLRLPEILTARYFAEGLLTSGWPAPRKLLQLL